jgi:hypothetical protein
MLKPLIVKVTRRSGHAQAAIQRRAPTFKHRNEPRGGASNDSRTLMAESEQELKAALAYIDWTEGW